ncbi:MAG: acyl-CoA desaturase [Burkholderiales bacterium]|jgi:fatty acid desaturase|nr:MAG: acyl-CoA desaturase [Burkholderiales bacterium]
MNRPTIQVGPRTVAEMNAFQQEVDAIGNEVRHSIGEQDARYIRKVLYTVRTTELIGRGLLMFGWFPPTFLLGAFILGMSKIIENMELGHNVMHGQFNWMNDPRFQGDTYEWDGTGPASGWRYTHNFVHHTYTNVIGLDRDFGYGMFRLSSELRWRWFYHPIQFFYMILMMMLFEWFVSVHEIQTDKLFAGKRTLDDVRPQWEGIKRKAGRSLRKEYVFLPLLGALLAWPFGHAVDVAMAVLTGNFIAAVIRNIWASAIIFCGHFTDGIYIFHRDSIKNETRGQWYLRQILGSSNISGSRLMHFMSGNLSHQIEHHLFPDLPANRYKDIAPQVRALCAKYNIPYNSGSFFRQLGTMFKRVIRYSLPGGTQKAEHLEVVPVMPEHA